MQNRIASLSAAVIAGLTLFSGSASAVSFGVGPIGGLNFANVNIDADGDEISTDMKTAFAIGARAELGVTKPFSVLLEPQFLRRGYSTEQTLLGTSFDVDIGMNYLELPVLAKAKFGSMKAHGYAFAGPSLGIFLNGTAEIDDESEDLEDISSINFAGQIGVGGAYQLKEFVYLNADVRYGYGFTNINDDGSDVDVQSRDIQLMLCVLFHLTE